MEVYYAQLSFLDPYFKDTDDGKITSLPNVGIPNIYPPGILVRKKIQRYEAHISSQTIERMRAEVKDYNDKLLRSEKFLVYQPLGTVATHGFANMDPTKSSKGS